MMMMMTCPRRADMFSRGAGVINQDHWRARGECSYCGSITAAEFLRRVEAGEYLVPTDKNYKAYIGGQHLKFYFQHLEREDRIRFAELWLDHKIQFAAPGYFYVVPYFMTGGD